MSLLQSFTTNTMSSGNAQIGKPAPDFKATAVVDGQFKEIKLSDYRGKESNIYWCLIFTTFQQHTQCSA